MSFEKQLVTRGVKLTEDSTLPMGERTVRNFKRVIAAVRAAEAESNDAIHQAEARCREAQDKVIELQKKNQMLQIEVMQLRMKERLAELQALTWGDRVKLLETVSH